MSMKIKLSSLILMLPFLALLAACTPDADKPKDKVAAPAVKVVVARVNGEPVYRADVLRRMSAAYGSGLEGLRADPNRWQMITDVATQSELMDKLLLQSAIVAGMTVTVEQAQELLKRTKELAGDPAFAEMLKERGASEEEFLVFLAQQELVSRYKYKLTGGFELEDDTLLEYYEGHVETFTQPAQVRLEIFTFGGSEAAQRIHDRWVSGESFDSITRAYEDEAERVGRRTRWMPLTAVPPELRPQITGGAVDTILEPVQVADKFYVVKVIDKMGARAREFEEVKDEIRKTILELRSDKALDDWYKDASAKAKIEYVR